MSPLISTLATERTMQTDFLLERFVHLILKADTSAARSLLQQAEQAGQSPKDIFTDILWPALECAHQLHHDGSFPPRLYNPALRAMSTLIDQLAPRLSRQPQNNRSLFIISALAEQEELGAHLTATLAESFGWTTYFGGANLSLEEITFSIGQLNPDVLLLHSGFAVSHQNSDQMDAVAILLKKLHHIRIWPKIQIAVLGPTPAVPHAADLIASDPLAIFELIALCPEYRTDPLPRAPLQFLGNAPKIHLNPDAIAALHRAHPHKLPSNRN